MKSLHHHAMLCRLLVSVVRDAINLDVSTPCDAHFPANHRWILIIFHALIDAVQHAIVCLGGVGEAQLEGDQIVALLERPKQGFWEIKS